MGLISLSLPPEIIERLTSEELLSALSSTEPDATEEVPEETTEETISEMLRETHEVAAEDAGPSEEVESDLATLFSCSTEINRIIPAANIAGKIQ